MAIFIHQELRVPPKVMYVWINPWISTPTNVPMMVP